MSNLPNPKFTKLFFEEIHSCLYIYIYSILLSIYKASIIFLEGQRIFNYFFHKKSFFLPY